MKKVRRGMLISSLIAVFVFFITAIDFQLHLSLGAELKIIENNPKTDNGINISIQKRISFSQLTNDENLNFTYEIISETDLTVSVIGLERKDNSESQSYNIEVPMSVSYDGKNYTVVEIGDNAFASKGTLVSGVVLPATVKKIGYKAFYQCTGITSIDLSNVENIGEEAFYGCVNLGNIYLSSKLTEIKAKTFYGTFKLKNITIPDSVLSIGESAFRNSGLVTIRVGKGLKRIDSYAFANLGENGNPEYNDKILQNIYFAGSAPTCGERIFANAKDEFKIYRSNKERNGWNEDYKYLTSLGTWSVLEPEGEYWRIGEYNSSFNVLDFVQKEIGQTTVETADNQRIKYRLNYNNYTATVISFNDVKSDMIIVPSSVIFDGNYKFDVVGIDTESALNNSKIKTIIIESENDFEYLISSDAFANLTLQTLFLLLKLGYHIGFKF